MNTNVMFSSKTDLWATPQDFFDELDREFHFTLDACALPENAKCERYFTPEQDGLAQDWNGVVWCNPPYGRKIGDWVKKAYMSFVGGANGGYVTSCKDRHKVVSRVHIQESRNSLCARKIEIRKFRKFCPVSQYGCNLQKGGTKWNLKES